MTALFLSFFVSLAATLMLIRVSAAGPSRSQDSDIEGPQKFHVRPVPRIGGVGVVLGLLAGASGLMIFDATVGVTAFTLLLCGAPAFVMGLIEDFTKNISPRVRLLATALSATLAFLLLDAGIVRSDLIGLDWLLGFTAGSFLLTIFAVTGIANSVNIIDGFNGLASMCVVLMLASLAFVGFQVGDHVVALLALAGIGAVFGFFVWNYPGGHIFLGDGGAYFLGFYYAELSLLLLSRNHSVSPMFPLLICIYPVFETLFSIYRRRFLRALPPSAPDGIHLHSLVYRRVIRWAFPDDSIEAMTRRNSMTSPFLWLLCMLSIVPAVFFWDQTVMLLLFIGVFGVCYVGLYWRIVRFKSPRWLLLGGRGRTPGLRERG